MLKVKLMIVGMALLLLTALAPWASAKDNVVGTVNFSGDPKFDVDSIAASGPKHWQWLSFPGGRLVLNPSLNDNHIAPPLGKDIPLNIGGWVGSKIFKLLDISHVLVSAPGATPAPATSLNTTWFPYKFTFDATYPGDVQVHGQDFFINVDSSFIRDLTITSGSQSTIELGENIPANEQVKWNPDTRVLVVSSNNYVFALNFVQISKQHASPAPADASIQPGKYVVNVGLPSGTSEVAIGFGFATLAEGEALAVTRATGCFHQSIAKSLAVPRELIESRLRRVPAPQKWGVNGPAGKQVSPAQHRQAYYAAWTFIIQDVVNPLPETSFACDQLMTGKPALWNGGDPRASGTAQWDSVLGYQWLCYTDCKAAWSAFNGLMSLVDADGAIAGESLSSRKAQTAWILYSRTHDRAQLEQVYPAIRKNLLWEEKNTRWIIGKRNNLDEKDLEFTASWIYDTRFAIKISTELGNSADLQMWKEKQAGMAENTKKWFFSDPSKIHQYFFANEKGTSEADRAELHRGTLSGYITQALAIRELAPDVRGRLATYFTSQFRPDQNGLGFDVYKYPDTNMTAYGLIDIDKSLAVAYTQGVLRESIQVGTFTEDITKAPGILGVEESLFSPMNIIEFTWLLNNCRYDNGSPTYVDLVHGASSAGAPLVTTLAID